MGKMILSVFAVLCVVSGWSAQAGRRVVLIVWDGMRPDFVNEKNTPTLHHLAQSGVFFEAHHSTYPSATEVNCASISTGGYPGRDGIVSNNEYRPAIDPLKSVHVEALEVVRKGDTVSRHQHVRMATISEMVRQHGGRTAVAGAKPVVLLADRSEREAGANCAVINFGTTLPPELEKQIVQHYGEFPGEEATHPTRNDWTTDALIDPLWSENIPEFTFLWLNQPDLSQHLHTAGSPEGLAAIRNADDNLAKILQTLKLRGQLETTDIIIASDHGCSTCSSQNDLAKILSHAGFAASRSYQRKPAKGDILAVSNSGSTALYVAGHDRDVTRRLVEFLEQQPFSGVVFTRDAMPGAFRLKDGHLDSPDAPDVMLSFHWDSGTNQFGVPGMLTTDYSTYPAGHGLHVSLSKYDMRATLVAAGPHFRNGIRSELPSGNVDIAPTVLWLLGIKAKTALDGRVLSEALVGKAPAVKNPKAGTLERHSFIGKSSWHQYLKYHEVNGVRYFDEGNGKSSIAAGGRH